jgi:hypothetical protein
MKRPLIGGKDFHNFYWTMRTSSRKGNGKLGCEKEENECVRELVIMSEEVLVMEENACKQKNMERSCVISNCSGVHEMISMNKPLNIFLE